MEVVDPGRYRVVDTPGIPDTDDFDTIMEYDEQDDSRKYLEDVTVDIGDMIAEGDKVVLRISATGTATAPFTHITTGVTVPAGKTITRRIITILTVNDGKVVEERTHEDRLGVLEQLDLAPSTQ
jgi:predicted ester cyclase